MDSIRVMKKKTGSMESIPNYRSACKKSFNFVAQCYRLTKLLPRKKNKTTTRGSAAGWLAGGVSRRESYRHSKPCNLLRFGFQFHRITASPRLPWNRHLPTVRRRMPGPRPGLGSGRENFAFIELFPLWPDN